MTLRWAGAPAVPQVPFGRLFRRVERPVSEGAAIVTAYTDGQVTLRSNRAKERYHEAADLSTFQGVEVGDFVVHGLDILRGSVGVSDSAGAMSPVVSVCEPMGPVDLRYVAHVIRVQAASGFTRAMARGIREGGADFRRWGTLAELPIPLPALEYQRNVCAFLDRETDRIDALIEEQQRLIEILHARKRAVLDEVTADVSGEPVRLKRLFAPSSDANYPNEQVLSVYRDYGVIPKASRDDNSNRTPDNLSRYLLVQPGDVVINRMKAWQGSLGVSNHRGIVSGDYEVLNPKTDRLVPRFAHLFLRSPRMVAEYAIHSTGIRPSQWRLYWNQMGTIEMSVPSLSQQIEVADRIDKQTAMIDTLIAETERFIELSRERRSALISAAVTGQIDVRVP